MAASITHLAVGERVFPQIPFLDPAEPVYGAFLAGCILVDVHAFHPIDRRHTHFVGRVEEDGEDAYRKSCSNFLGRLDTLLSRPWNDLPQTGRAFVTGYLCHLAADECWKELGWRLFQKFNITDWRDFPVPPDVSLTVFDFLSHKTLHDPAAAYAALRQASIPDVFTHVSQATFCHQWDVIQAYVWNGATPEANTHMLALAGKPADKVQAAHQRHIVYWDQALAMTEDFGGVFPFLQNCVDRTGKVIPLLDSRQNPIHPTLTDC